MNTVTIGISTLEETSARFIAACETGEPQGAFISFPSTEALWRTLTPKRWEIIKALTGAGPTGIRALARRVQRDVKAVHGDAQALVQCGVLEKTSDGKVEFPYDAVHVDFVVGPPERARRMSL